MSFKSKILHCLVFIWAINIYVIAQRSDSTNLTAAAAFNMFREPSYISFFGGVGNIEPLIFEGDIIPYFMISLNQESRWGIELSPRILVRMYNKDSYPVRTPSYMPRVTYFHQIIDSKRNDIFTYFSWFHHSNGQDGPFYNADSSSINTSSGSFSTNFFETGFFLSRPDKRKPGITNFLKISANYCYELDNELKPIYGRLRFFSDFQSILDLSKALANLGFTGNSIMRKKFLYQSIRLGWIAGEKKDAADFDLKRLIFRYTLSYKPSFLNDVTLFAQYYYGQDYYNIYFNRSLSVLRFGIAAKTSLFN